MARDRIRHCTRYRRRRKALLSFAVKFFVEIALGSFPAETVAGYHTGHITKRVVELDSGIGDRLASSDDPEMRERIQP